MAVITIVGAGVMGTAIAWPLCDNGHTVRLVGTPLDRDTITSCQERRFHPHLQRELPNGVRPLQAEELATALDGAAIVVSGVSSFGVHWVGRALAPYLRPEQTVLAVTKGLEVDAHGRLMILPDVLRRQLPLGLQNSIEVGAIGGPCIAGELAGRRPSCVVFSVRDPAHLARLAPVFRTAYYHVWTTTDLVGLEYCAALKNAYAVGVGLALGRLEKAGGPDSAGAQMHNLAAAVFAQACVEMHRMLALVGGIPALAYGLPGAGDLYVTARAGRNVRIGTLLGQCRSVAEARQKMAGLTVEGIEVIRVLATGLLRLTEEGRLGLEELPLMRALIQIVVHDAPQELELARFFGGEV